MDVIFPPYLKWIYEERPFDSLEMKQRQTHTERYSVIVWII